MNFRHRHLVIVVLVSLSAIAVCLLYIEFKRSNGVVANVNGTIISYGDIRADPKVVQLLYAGQMDARRLRTEVRKYEERRLAQEIRKAIFKHKIDELGITATDEKVDSRVEEIFRKADMTDVKAAAICETAKAVYNALVEWHNNPSREDAIYNEKLKGSLVTREQWKAYQSCFDTPEKLKRFAVPSNIEDMKRMSRESSRKDVLYAKLRDIVTSDVSVSDNEIKQAYEEKYGYLVKKPSLEEVKGTLRSELLTKKKQQQLELWWQEQYKEARIDIKDPRFKDVLDIFKNPERVIQNTKLGTAANGMKIRYKARYDKDL